MVSRIANVRAPNPSAMTLTGTNSYVIDIGNGEALVVDPGPLDLRHVDALIDNARSRGLTITAIALTHGHPDHAPAAAVLAQRTSAPVYVHPHSEVPHDRHLPLDADWTIGGTTFRVIDAPGHTFEHVIFYEPEEAALFTGDVILGEGTVVIAPPGGAMRPYMNTLARLRDEFPQARRIYGGHGPLVDRAQDKIAEYIAHREMRQNELLEALREGPQTIPELVQRIYGDTRRILWPAAARQMLAYLMPLTQEGVVHAVMLDRPLTDEETAILNPSWESIVGAEHAPLIEAELGAMLKLDKVYEYSLR
ncbi:MAG: MBL fold metallo-hydrolase [Candidatus Eremiobacteraeota bacterium]|nr:MBL fold metallo-hydrolase [Candidatus Eremiobacteraeota bacterium]